MKILFTDKKNVREITLQTGAKIDVFEPEDSPSIHVIIRGRQLDVQDACHVLKHHYETAKNKKASTFQITTNMKHENPQHNQNHTD